MSILVVLKKNDLNERQKHVELCISRIFLNVIRSSDLITFLSLCIFSETVCDKGSSLVVFKRFSEKLCTENETRLLRKMVYGVQQYIGQFYWWRKLEYPE